MKPQVPIALVACGLACSVALVQWLSAAEDSLLTITSRTSRGSDQGAPDRFTGRVIVEPLFDAREGRRMSAGTVIFPPTARSGWHTHPAGQVLVVTAGSGLVQVWGGPIQAMKAGDVVWIPAGVKHWHGASPTSAVTHIAIQENVDGKAVDWLEPVTAVQYSGVTDKL